MSLKKRLLTAVHWQVWYRHIACRIFRENSERRATAGESILLNRRTRYTSGIQMKR